MFYKITDQTSEAYLKVSAKLNEMTAKRDEAKEKVKAAVDFPFHQYIGGSDPFNVVGYYSAFKPLDESYTPEKHWAPYSKAYEGFYRPNTRTKKGKEIAAVLSSLPSMMAFEDELYPNMQLTRDSVLFCNYYQYTEDRTILIKTSDIVESLGVLMEGMVEITSSEFNELKAKKEIAA